MSALPPAIPLDGETIRLEPLAPRHLAALAQAASDERIWGYSVRGDTDAYLAAALKSMESGEAVPFVAIEKANGRVIGMSRLFEIDDAHKRLEIGYTWYIPKFWGTKVNPEAKLLLMTHAFEVWGARRVQYKIHSANLRSRAAVEKLGGVFEGIMRRHMIQPDGSQRDTAVYSILDDEWPAAKEKLRARLA